MSAVFALFLLLHSQAMLAAENNPESPLAILSLKLTDSGLSRRAQQHLRGHIMADKIWQDFTLEDVVKVRLQELKGRSVFHEIEQYVSQHGLKLGMWESEVEFFKANGRLPNENERIVGTRDVRSLPISARARRVLLNNNVKTLSDYKNTSLQELMQTVDAGPATVREILDYFKSAGFTLYRTKAERECGGELDSSTDSL